MTKADKIRELKRNDPSLTSTEIAERVNSSPGYVRDVWKESSDNVDNGDDELGELPERDDGTALDELRNDDDDGGGANVDPDGPLGELIISDDWDEYECSECGASVEYLQETCDKCDEALAWWDA